MTLRWRAFGALESLDADTRAHLLNRAWHASDDVRATVMQIGARVRRDGDAALIEMAREFDGADLDALEVPRDRWAAALDGTPAATRRALERAARNIADVSRAFAPSSSEFVTSDGVVIGRHADPLARVGVYAPGGRAAYPSSVLMGVVPAVVAGVGEVIVCSPPARDGAPSTVVLAAAAIAGASRVFSVGGAGAIFALAHGTASIPRVDRIVGPGNAYVAEAKLQVAPFVAIDSPAGPSELLVVADGTSNPDYVACELIAQAEHDPAACVAVVGSSEAWTTECARAVQARVSKEPRADIITAAFAANGAALWTANPDAAIEFANEYAAEHLLLAGEAAARWLPDVRNSGAVFTGVGASVVFGDYLTGGNHVLPTGGLARSYSGLSAHDFVRWTTYQRIGFAAAARLADDTATLATAEGLPAHARAAQLWSMK